MSEEFSREVRIETSLDAYRNFFSDDWAKRIESLTARAAKIYAIVFDLVMEWRAAAYTASLPISILEHMKGYHDGFVNTGHLNTNLLRLAEVLPAMLARELPELTVDPSSIPLLQKKLIEIGANFEDARSQTQIEFPMDETWDSYLQNDVYRLSLWGSQRICFVSIYNLYENYLVQSVRIANCLSSCRSSGPNFKGQLVASFGAPLRDKCWTSNKMNLARLARHALTHAGGRVTDDLAKHEHGFVVSDGRIQVMPANTKDLFTLLKECAYAVAEKAVTMPEFE